MDSDEHGLRELGGGCYAWLQPDGGWGWSNSGLIAGDGCSLMVDSLFDLSLTRRMLDGVAPLLERRPVRTLVNTHSDADHVFGNELIAAHGAEIIASEAAAALMTQDAVDRTRGALRLPGAAGDFMREVFRPFDFAGITMTPPTRTFTGTSTLDVGGRRVDLIEVGPAHTVGDVLVLVPDARTLYAGDVLFSAGTPIVWSGPIERWIAALDLILEMDVDTIVPGHGPVAGKGDVAEMRAYLATVDEQARTRYADGLSVDEAIDTIDLGRFASRPEHGRLAQNVVSVYRQLDPDMALPSPVEVLGRIAALEGFAAADAR